MILYQKYVRDTKFYKLFDCQKLFEAQSLTSARALGILYHLCQKTMIFEISQRYEIRRAPRTKFFWKCNLHDKISLQLFLFGHISKSEFFRAIWSLKFFFENSIFSQNFGILKILKIFNFFFGFFMKKSHIQKHLQQSI